MRSTLQQSLAALLVLAFVVGQVGSFVHAAFERHAVCAEHGEIVHVNEHGHAGLVDPGGLGQAAGPAEAPRDDHASLRDGATAGDGHAHEHCYACPASREPLTSHQSSDAIAAVMPAAPLQPSLPAVVSPGDRARYIIAPKTSPPV